MSFIEFESAREKERVRQELREVRAEILKRAEEKAKLREEKDKKEKLENQWLLPSISKKIDQMSSSMDPSQSKKKKSKKSKKVKKEKKTKKKKKKRSRSSSSSEEEKIKKKKKKKKFSETSSSSSDSNDSADEWVEKGASAKDKVAADNPKLPEKPLVRDDWMGGMLIPTFSKVEQNPKKDEKKGLDAYDPAKSALELNPHWKSGSGGLPTAFQKPSHDSDDERDRRNRYKANTASSSRSDNRRSGGWRKNDSRTDEHSSRGSQRRRVSRSRSRSTSRSRSKRSRSRSPKRRNSSSTSSSSSSRSRSKQSKSPRRNTSSTQAQGSVSSPDLLTDQELSELAASQIKAEMSGNSELAQELQVKLDKARKVRKSHKESERQPLNQSSYGESSRGDEEEGGHVLLTVTNSKGVSKPFHNREADLWGGRAGRKVKKPKVETHVGGERVRYFADDDNYDIKQMFEKEKYSTAADQDIEFATIAGQHKNPNDDLEDLFSEKASKRSAESTNDRKDRERAIQEHQQMAKTLEECDKCIASEKMKKQLIVAMGTNAYVSLPWHEGLQLGHCVISPLSHVSCSTQLDEDVWTEMVDFMKALNRMFTDRKQDVIFFETARYLHKKPHMQIHCVPSDNFELAPFFFKKAIQESEEEWATNKQLIDLKGRDVRRAIPKGLPYFWVKFGVDQGFGHVIEDQSHFPSYFAQEVIGGLLEMEPKLWKKPWKIQNARPKVQQFAEWWKPYDFSS